MDVRYIKAIEIDGIGLFKKVSEWESFSKWESFDNPNENFISVDEAPVGMLKLFTIESGDSEIVIIYATPAIAEKLEEINTAPEAEVVGGPQ